jgi:hypothetical protein
MVSHKNNAIKIEKEELTIYIYIYIYISPLILFHIILFKVNNNYKLIYTLLEIIFIFQSILKAQP